MFDTRLRIGVGLSQLSQSDHYLIAFLAGKNDDGDGHSNLKGGDLSFLAIQLIRVGSSTFSNEESVRVNPLFIVEAGFLSPLGHPL
ncbi:hypothetical protein BLNAU_185 [Blattamonas nauphoetae]|uniref:Uncharacterized protein n=1 Tax=Blattamonas nauphoetae TaxID=2049346 RepID=A0ABQ9YMA4_9EUKA|nr:hypothetical protein BLNAU_185 [Blattamonas nauphoetae]